MSEKKKKNLLKQKVQNSLPNQLPHPVYLLVQKKNNRSWGAATKSVIREGEIGLKCSQH